MAAPPSLNLLSEIFLINRLVSWHYSTIIFLGLISFFRAAYSLFLYSYTQHGVFYSGFYAYFSCRLREFLLLIMHWMPLNVMFLKMEIFSMRLYLNSLINKILICGIKDIVNFKLFLYVIIFFFFFSSLGFFYFV